MSSCRITSPLVGKFRRVRGGGLGRGRGTLEKGSLSSPKCSISNQYMGIIMP